MDLLKRIQQAGVVGCGGAGFPTHVKLNAHPEYFIVNAAECEPLLRTDRWLMIHRADALIAGADAICAALGVRCGVIALKESYRRETAALREAIAAAGSQIQLHQLEAFYPAGDEQTIVYEVTGRVVPPAGIPLDVGAVVDNVATVIAVCDALQGKPLTHKYLTVTGEVNRPCVLKVPVGTSFAYCFALAGGLRSEDVTVMAGGPMMGRPLSLEHARKTPVTKTTNGILVLKKDTKAVQTREVSVQKMLHRAKSACIQCEYCTSMCPRYLLGHPLQPHMIMRKFAAADGFEGLLDDTDVRQAAICCECGICELYACPMGLNPRRINSLVKTRLAQEGIRYHRTQEIYRVREARAYRKAPTRRVAARAGVLEYDDINDHVYIEDCPDMVELLLQMHIGVPAQPVVREGQSVRAGECIAVCPEGKLGAHIHASIDGVVSLTQKAVIIRGGEDAHV